MGARMAVVDCARYGTYYEGKFAINFTDVERFGESVCAPALTHLILAYP